MQFSNWKILCVREFVMVSNIISNCFRMEESWRPKSRVAKPKGSVANATYRPV